MSEIATTIPPKGLGSLRISDFWKSLFLAALVNILLVLYPIINAGNWPSHSDLDSMLKSTIAIIMGYLIKNLTTNNVGQLFKKDKPIVHVDAKSLSELQAKAGASDSTSN
jgi:hypothetical protein